MIEIIMAASETTGDIPASMVTVGVASMIALFTTISGFVLKSATDVKKSFDTTLSQVSGYYDDILREKERQVESLIESRKDDLASQREHFIASIETQNKLLFDPIEKRVQVTEEKLVYYREQVLELKKQLNDSENHIKSLEEFKKKYEIAVEYIDSLIEYAAGRTDVEPEPSQLIVVDIKNSIKKKKE